MFKGLFKGFEKKVLSEKEILDRIIVATQQDSRKAISVLTAYNAENGFYTNEHAVSYDVLSYMDNGCQVWLTFALNSEDNIFAVNRRKQMRPGTNTCVFDNIQFNLESIRGYFAV